MNIATQVINYFVVTAILLQFIKNLIFATTHHSNQEWSVPQIYMKTEPMLRLTSRTFPLSTFNMSCLLLTTVMMQYKYYTNNYTKKFNFIVYETNLAFSNTALSTIIRIIWVQINISMIKSPFSYGIFCMNIHQIFMFKNFKWLLATVILALKVLKKNQIFWVCIS